MNPHTIATRVRIYSHVTRSRFLHVEDALAIGKARLFAGIYSRGQGMESHAHHFVDLADARVIFSALKNGKPGFNYKEYKSTPPQPGKRPAVSRVLSVAVKGENVYLELKSGPGKLTATGAITPDGQPQVAVNVGFKLYEAQRLAATVLAYIQAWDVLRIMCHQQLVSPPAPYLLVATEAVGTEAVGTEAAATGTRRTGALTPADSGMPQEGLAASSQVTTHNGSRPITRKDPLPRTNGRQAAAPVRPPVPAAVEVTAAAIYGSGDLRYGDGSAVDAGNLAEVQAFQRFVTERKNAPSSKPVLQAFYRQQMAA